MSLERSNSPSERVGPKGRRKALTLPRKFLTDAHRAVANEVFGSDDADIADAHDLEDFSRPQTRGDCKDGVRPCPFACCKHHLYLDVNPDTGSIKLTFPDLEIWEMEESCSLDVADRGSHTLLEIAPLMRLTRERIRQVEQKGLKRLGKSPKKLGEEE